MNHMTEEQLIAYRDGETSGRAILTEHLQDCADCQREMARLDAVFAALDAMPIPNPGEGLADRVWQNISPRLQEKRSLWWQTFFASRHILAFGTVAALIVLAFFIGRFTKGPALPGTESAGDSGKVRERVLVVAVGNHLGRSEMVLMELANAEPQKGQKLMNISAEQKRAEDLLEENRLYRQTALRDGDKLMASTLDDLEPILLDIANSPDEITPAQFEAIQKRIAAKGILLKIRVVHQDLREREGTAKPTPAPSDADRKERNKA
jgi:hypothetical protein